MMNYNELHIPKPCHINYDKLPSGKGKKHCLNCNSFVHDFRGVNIDQFNEIWKKNNGEICGVFTHNQFDVRPIDSRKYSLLNIFKNKLFQLIGFITLIFSSSKSFGQNSSNQHKTEQVESTNKFVSVKIKKSKNSLNQRSIRIAINDSTLGIYSINDSLFQTINLPDSVTGTDIINIEGRKRSGNRGWYKYTIKVNSVDELFENGREIEVPITRRNRIRLIYRRDWVGCPKFR